MTTTNTTIALSPDELDKQRADFEAWARDDYEMTEDDLKKPHDGRYFWMQTHGMWKAWQAAVTARARAAQPAVVGAELPPLPARERHNFDVYAYTEDQMRQYARAAITADRAQQQQAGAAALSDDLVQRLREHNDERLYLEADVLMAESADAIADLRAQLARQGQGEPVAVVEENDEDVSVINAVLPIGTKLYTSPAQASAAQADELTVEEQAALDRLDKPEWRAASLLKLRAMLAVEVARTIRLGATIENLQDELDGAATEQARAAVLEEAAQTCDAIFDSRGGIAFLYAAQQIRALAASPTVPAQPVAAAADAGELLPCPFCGAGITDAGHPGGDCWLANVMIGRGEIAAWNRRALATSAAAQPVAKDAAARIPTEAMLNAARDWSVKKYGIGIGNDAAIGCWQAMHDAAMQSTTTGATDGAEGQS